MCAKGIPKKIEDFKKITFDSILYGDERYKTLIIMSPQQRQKNIMCTGVAKCLHDMLNFAIFGRQFFNRKF